MKTKERTIWIMAPVLAISVGFLVPKAAAQLLVLGTMLA